MLYVVHGFASVGHNLVTEQQKCPVGCSSASGICEGWLGGQCMSSRTPRARVGPLGGGHRRK